MTRRQRVVVITGASAGVGRATAREFAERGDFVALLARGAAGLDGARRDVERLGSAAMVLPTDVADPSAVDLAADAVVQQWGRIDVWVNNAMASVFSPVHEMSAAEYRRVTEVTYLGAVHGTMAALRHMRPRDRGVIVQVGSALAYRSIPLQSAYCAAKHALVGFTDSLRCELLHEHSRLHLTVVQLPALNTPQFRWVRNRMGHAAQPVPPIFQPEVAARAIEWASRHRRREVWVGASTYQAIVGQKLAPDLLDRYLGRNGYSAQQLPDQTNPDAPDNLWHPVDETVDYGAHGTFDNRAHAVSRTWPLTTSRNVLLAAAAVGVAGLLGGKASHRIRKRRVRIQD